MRYIVEDSLRNFEFWSGVKENAKMLNWRGFDALEDMLECDEIMMTDTQINDWFWFEFENVLETIGVELTADFKDFYCGEEYINEDYKEEVIELLKEYY